MDTIKNYVDLHKSTVAEHLQDLGLLEEDGSVSKNKNNQEHLHNWFLESISNYEASETEATVEIGSHESRSGLPILFDFDEALMIPIELGQIPENSG
jgi:hypothetical protein